MPTQQMVIKDDTMNRSRALLAATLTASVLTANATPFQLGTSYAGLNYALFAYRENGIGKDLEPTALVGKLGHFIFDQLSVEGRFGLGVSDDTIKAGNGVDVTGDLDRMFGLYATGHFPLGEHASVYALIGFTDIRATFPRPAFRFPNPITASPMVLARTSIWALDSVSTPNTRGTWIKPDTAFPQPASAPHCTSENSGTAPPGHRTERGTHT